MRILKIVIVLVSCLIPAAVMADSNQKLMDMTRETLEVLRRQMLENNMELSVEERKGFWTLYNEYKSEREKLGNQLFALVVDYSETYKNLTDEKSIYFLEATIRNEEQRLKLKRTYIKKFSEIISPKKVATFIQIENKFWAAVLYGMAEVIPVIE